MKKNRNLNVVWTVIILVITTIFGIYVGKNMYFDSTFYAFLDRTSPTLIAGETIARKYGDTTSIMVLLPFDPDNAEESLREVDKVVRALQKIPFIQSVESILNAQKNGGLLFGAPFIRFLPYVTVTEDPENPDNREYSFDASILRDPAYAGVLISEDGRSVTVMLRKNAEMKVQAIELRDRIQSEIRSATSVPFKLIGEEIVDAELFDSVRVLALVYTPLIGIVVLGIFLLKFRSLFLSFLTLVPPLLSSIWVYFFMLVFHRNINSLTVLIPTFIIIIGSAYGMHYLSRFLEIRKESYYAPDRETGNLSSSLGLSTIIQQATKEEWMPILFSSLTTMAGFASNIFLKMEAFRDMGIFASLGILLCGVFTMVVTPSFILFYKKEPALKKERSFSVAPARMPRIGRYFKWAFIGFTLAGIGLSPFLIPKVSLELDSYRYFKEDSTVRQSAEQLKSDFGWSSNLYLVFETIDGRQLSIISEEEQKIKTLLDKIQGIPQIANQMSIVKMSESLKIPTPLLITATRMSAQGKEMVRSFLNEDSFRVMLFLTSNDSTAAKEAKTGIESAWRDSGLTEDYKIQLTGAPLIWAELSALVVNNQVESTLIAFGLILLLLFLSFRSVKTALFSSIPIVITVVFNFLFMSALRISLDIPTAIVAGMLQGLVIDYAIHFMFWYKKTQNVEDAFRKTASPILFNGVSLIGCFAVLLTSPMMVYVKIALLMVLGIAVGVLSTLVFLPALLQWHLPFPVKTAWSRRKDERDQKVHQHSSD